MTRQRAILRVVSVVVSVVFLWTNCIWAGEIHFRHYNPHSIETLAVQNCLEDTILEAQIMYTADVALKTLIERSIATNKDIYVNIDQMREDYIEDVAGLTLADKEKIGWLVYADERYTDEEKPYSERERYREYKAYYAFTGNGIFFRYTPVVREGEKLEVKDSIKNVLHEYGRLVKDEELVEINGKRFYREKYRITDENVEFINICMADQLGEIIVPKIQSGANEMRLNPQELGYKRIFLPAVLKTYGYSLDQIKDVEDINSRLIKVIENTLSEHFGVSPEWVMPLGSNGRRTYVDIEKMDFDFGAGFQASKYELKNFENGEPKWDGFLETLEKNLRLNGFRLLGCAVKARRHKHNLFRRNDYWHIETRLKDRKTGRVFDSDLINLDLNTHNGVEEKRGVSNKYYIEFKKWLNDESLLAEIRFMRSVFKRAGIERGRGDGGFVSVNTEQLIIQSGGFIEAMKLIYSYRDRRLNESLGKEFASIIKLVTPAVDDEIFKYINDETWKRLCEVASIFVEEFLSKGNYNIQDFINIVSALPSINVAGDEDRKKEVSMPEGREEIDVEDYESLNFVGWYKTLALKRTGGKVLELDLSSRYILLKMLVETYNNSDHPYDFDRKLDIIEKLVLLCKEENMNLSDLYDRDWGKIERILGEHYLEGWIYLKWLKYYKMLRKLEELKKEASLVTEEDAGEVPYSEEYIWGGAPKPKPTERWIVFQKSLIDLEGAITGLLDICGDEYYEDYVNKEIGRFYSSVVADNIMFYRENGRDNVGLVAWQRQIEGCLNSALDSRNDRNIRLNVIHIIGEYDVDMMWAVEDLLEDEDSKVNNAACIAYHKLIDHTETATCRWRHHEKLHEQPLAGDLARIRKLISEGKVKEAGQALQEFSKNFNYSKVDDEVRFNQLLVEKSKLARELAGLIIRDEALVEEIKNRAFGALEDFIRREVESERMDEGKGRGRLGEAKKYISEWLDKSNNIPIHIRTGIIRGMLEGRDSDLLFAFGEGWRKFGTAGIRNPAVASEYGAILELELQEFADNPHAAILTGTNMINTVTLLQQEAAIVRLFGYLSENIDDPKLNLAERFKENIKNKKITIAYDSRLNGEYFAKMLAAAFLRDEFNVDLFDNAAGMPALVYASDRMGSTFGFLVSASHSEANYNGFKAVLGHLASQLDAAGKDMVMTQRKKVAYQDMHLDLAEMQIKAFENIFSIKKHSLKWLGNPQRLQGVNYCGAEFVDFYTGYYEHVANRSPLVNLDEGTRVTVRGDLQVFYTAFYGVGAIPAGNLPGFLKQQGYGNVSIVKKQTETMDGRFEGHYMPDPGVVSGWVVNLVDYIVQEAGGDFRDIGSAIEKLNAQEVGVATDPDIDRAGMMLGLPTGIKGNIKDALIQAVRLYMDRKTSMSDAKKKEVIEELNTRLNDKYLLTANDAWAFMAYYQLKLLEENGLISKDRIYFIEESHVTTPALERIAGLFRKKGYKIYVVQTYVGFTELAKKSRDLFNIAKISFDFLREYEQGLGDNWRERVGRLPVDLENAYKELRSNVPSGANRVPEIEEIIRQLKGAKNQGDLKGIVPLLKVLSNMQILYGVEESNGYGEFGRFDPQSGEEVDSHICEKDGSLAAFKFLEIIAYGKQQGKSGYEMFKSMIEEIGHINTDNRFLPHPGLKGNDEKEDEVEALEKIFAYVLQRALDRGEEVYLFNGKYKVERVEVYRDHKYDDIYNGFPEEGIRLYLKTKKGSEIIVTLRPSGTGDTIRSYAWILGPKPEGGTDLEIYRETINGELEVLARDFFGNENLQGKGVPPLGYVDQSKEEFSGLLAALKEGDRQRYGEVFAKAMGQERLSLTKEETDLIEISGELAFGDRKGYRAEPKIRARNNSAVETYLNSEYVRNYPEKIDVIIFGRRISIPKAALLAWRVSIVSYLASLVPMGVTIKDTDIQCDEAELKEEIVKEAHRLFAICGFNLDIDESVLRMREFKKYEDLTDDIKDKIEKLLPDLAERFKSGFIKVIDNQSPYLVYESPSKFMISVNIPWSQEVFITYGLLELLLVNEADGDAVILLKAILEYGLKGYGKKVCELQGEYLAEEIYLLANKSNLVEGIKEFIRSIATVEFNADEESKCKVLDVIIEKIYDGKGDLVSEEMDKLLQEDMQTNNSKKAQGDIELLSGKGLDGQDIKPGRYGDMVILPEVAEIFVVGDTHGDSESAKKVVREFEERLKSNKNAYIVFLGDYVNNGLDSIGNLLFVLGLREKYPGRVILLNGNHEFRETYMTVLKEFFRTHWDNATKSPFPDKKPEDRKHYSHIRLELIIRLGVEEGERIYKLFEKWGRSLPYLCLSKSGIMMSHSIGLLKGITEVDLKYLAEGKTGDEANIKELGYEAWKKAQATSHSVMVNYRKIDGGLLDCFKKLGIYHFIVGHTHYRSGDTTHPVPSLNNRFYTICSSIKESPKAGHYMYQEMVRERMPPKGAGYEEKREGIARPCYAVVQNGGIVIKYLDQDGISPIVGQHSIYTAGEEEWLSILEKSTDELVGDTMRGTKEYKREVKAKLIRQKAALNLLRSMGPKAFLEDKRIRRAIDRQGMIDRIRTRLKNLEENIDDTTDGIKEVLNSRFSQEDRYKIKKIKIVGLGGSAAAGELALDVIRTYKGLGYEAEVVRDVRSIKEKIEDDTLVILVSFSGNTDEMINAAEELKRHSSNNPKIIALTGSRGNGGILGRIAGMQGWPHIKLPHTEDLVRGRESIIIQMISILTILSELNFPGEFDIWKIGLKDSLSFLNGQCAGKYDDSIPYERNVAMQMALSLLYGIDYDGEGKPPHLDPYTHRKEPYIIIGEQMRSIGAKFQGELSGHAEVVSSFYTTPEFYHDTIEAVKTAYEQEGESWNKYSMLFLRSEDEYPETRERLEEVIREIFPDGEGRRYQRIAEGDTPFKRILDLFLFTEWVGLYMSLLNGIDPVPQSITEYLVRRIPIAEFKETAVKEETREDRRGFIAKESVESAGEPEDSGLSIFRMPEKIKPKPLNQKEHAILEAHLYEFRHNSYIRSYLDKLKSMGVKIKFAELSDDLVLRIGDELYLDISLLRGKTYEDRIPSILLHSILRYEVYRGSCVNAFTEDEFIEDVAATLAELEELMAIYIGTPEQQILDFWQFTRRRVEILLEQLNPQAAKRLRTKLDLAYLLAKKPGLYQRKTGYSIDGIKEVLRDVLNTKKYKSVKNRLEGKTDELAEKILREREIRILREDLARFRDYHIEELDKREKAWDYIFIAAANEAQAEAFQKELEYRRDILDSFHPHTNVDVIFPPKDQNIGNGGAALYAVRKAAEAIASEKPGKRYKSIEDIFKGKRVLLILSGGDSKRIPIFSATGKAFTTVPTKLETGGAGVSNERKPTSSLFDEIYTMLSGAVTKMDDGMIVIPGDAQMVFDYEHVELDRPGELDGLVEVVWRILADEGHKRIENHGVRIASKGSEGILVHSAEKLTVEKLLEWKKKITVDGKEITVNAIGDDSRANLSTALIKLDVDTMVRMAKLGGLVLENGRPGKEDSLGNTVMAEIPLELYADILPVFGLSMDRDRYVAVKDAKMRAAREKIWDVLREPGREVRYHVQSTSPFIFADFGTTKQFQEHLATRDDVNQVYQFPSWLNHFVDMGVDVSEEAKVYDSILLGREGRVQPGAIVVYSKLDKGFDIGRGAIVYGVRDSQGRLKVKDNNVIYQLPVKIDGKETIVSVLFGMDDDPKQLLYGEYVAIDNEGKETKRKGSRMRFGSSKTRATLFGRDFLRWLEDIGIAPDEVWDKSVPDDKRSLWNAKLYVPGDEDFSLTLWMQEEGTPDKDILSKWRETKRLSMEDIVLPDIIDHTRLFIQRDEIRKDPRILLGGGRLSSFDQKIRDVWEYILENSLKETDRDKRLIKYDPIRFDNSDFPSKELKSRGDSRVGRRGNLIVRYDPRRGEDAKDKEVEVKVVQEVTEGESVFSKLPMKNELLTGPIIVKGNRYRVIANISPIFRYHVLFVSEELRPQVLAEGDIESAIALMRDNRIKLYFNSWGAAASVNHFHLQGSYGYSDEYQPVETDRLPVENAPIEPLFRVCDVKVGCVAEYPATCLVFEADEEVSLSRVFYDFVRFLQREDVNVPHNVLFTHNKIFIFLKATRDRKTITTGIDINPAAPELAGIITVKTSGFKDKLPTLEDLQGALRDATVNEDELKGLLSRYLSILQKKESYFFLMDREITRLGLLAKSSDNNTRLEAIRKLAHINNPFAVDVLIEAIRDRFYAVYLEAARGLGEIKNKKAVAPLVEVLNSQEGGRLLLKREAAISLGKIRDGKAIEALEKVMRDCPYEIVRKASAWALGEIGGKDAFRILLKALETEKSALVRREIALAIVKTGIEAQGKIEQVKRMFNKEPDWQVRKAMVKVLFNLGDKDLSGLETGQDIEVRAEVLRVRTGKTHLDTIGVVQKHWHGEVQNSLEHARLYSPKIDVYLPDEEFAKREEQLDKVGLIEELWDREGYWEQFEQRSERLGWLRASYDMTQTELTELMEFGEEAREKYEYVVIMGMGGATQGIYTYLNRFGFKVDEKGFWSKESYPKFYILDTSSPGARETLDAELVLDKTLFIYSSKAGGAPEPAGNFEYFYEKTFKGDKKGHFVIITDPDFPLDNEAKSKGLRVFHSMVNIGGRFTALSTEMLVPAVIMGVDIDNLLRRVRDYTILQLRCYIRFEDNPAVRLAVTLDELRKKGRNKITLVSKGNLEQFAPWLEQLLAESLGKGGRGIVPISGEELSDTDVYRDDRVFIYIANKSEEGEDVEKKLELLQSRHPVVRITVPDNPEAVGELFFIFEMCTAILGRLMQINPFDEPGVIASKQKAGQILKKGTPERNGEYQITKGAITMDYAAVMQAENAISEDELSSALRRLGETKDDIAAVYAVILYLIQGKGIEYAALLPYIRGNKEEAVIWNNWRSNLRQITKMATFFGEGPRYQHSALQLFQDGPNTGFFTLLGEDNDEEGNKLIKAQRWGTLEALQEAGRMVVNVSVPKLNETSRRQLAEFFENSFSMLERLLSKETETHGSHIVQEVKRAEKGLKEERVFSFELKKKGELGDLDTMPSEIDAQETIRQYKDMLSTVMDMVEEEHKGLGIFMATDQIEVVRNLRARLYRQGRAPLAVYVVENGVRKIKVDVKAFKDIRLLFEEMEHEFSESIARIVPGSNPGVSDVVATVKSVRNFLKSSTEEQDRFLGILDSDGSLDPDKEYQNMLRRLRGIKGLTDNELIASVVRYVLRTKLYRHMRKELGLPQELAARIRDLDPRLDDALAVFNEIAKAREGIELVEKVKEREELSIQVVKTFSGVVRIKGLEKLSKRLAGIIAGLVKVASKMHEIASLPLAMTGDKYCIVIDKDRIPEELRDDWERRIKGLEGSGMFKVVYSLDEALKDYQPENIIHLIDPADIKEKMPEGILYLPMPYLRSSLYISAMVVMAGGKISKVNELAMRLLYDLYPGLEDLTPAEQELLFTEPWSKVILPAIASVIAEINNIHMALEEIEDAA